MEPDRMEPDRMEPNLMPARPTRHSALLHERGSARRSLSLALGTSLALFGTATTGFTQPPADDTPLASHEQSEDDGLVLDQTGIRWYRPFADALAAAEATDRLLLIKPIAFGTNRAGCW